MKCLPWTGMQTVFKARHFYKALNQEWSHVLIEKERKKGEVELQVHEILQ